MARRCGGAEYPSSEHNFNIKEMLSEAGWCLVAHRSLREKMIRARDLLLRVSTWEEISTETLLSWLFLLVEVSCLLALKIFVEVEVESGERWPGRSLHV